MTEFIIITPAYNCEKKIERTLFSVIGQTYKNWKLFLIDDMSTDGTVDLVRKVTNSLSLNDKIEIISREEKFGETRNTFDVVNKLDPNNVVVRLDAGDFITDLGCLELLNEIYKTHNPAVLWTKHRWGFSGQNISGPIDSSVSLYQQPWRSSHMKTFRVKEFLGLNKNNFLDEDGNWIMIACDQAVFLPMMERARLKGRPLLFFDEVLYHYDIDLSDRELFTRDRSIHQKQSAEMIRARGYIE